MAPSSSSLSSNSSSNSRLVNYCRRAVVTLILLATVNLFFGSVVLHSTSTTTSRHSAGSSEALLLQHILQENRVSQNTKKEFGHADNSAMAADQRSAKETATQEEQGMSAKNDSSTKSALTKTKSFKAKAAVKAPAEIPSAADVNTATMPAVRRNISVTTDLGPILDDTIRLLLPPDQADAYIQQHPGSKFKMYIYDTLPTQFTWQHSADCMNQRSDIGCDWAESFCGVSIKGGGEYAKRRFNRNGDVVMAKLFSDYNGPSRTYVASEATLFVVPFPSQAHLHCQGRNAQSYYDLLQRDLLSQLQYLTPATKHQHLFLSSAVQPSSNKWLRKELPLVVSIGQVQHECRRDKHTHERPNCGQIIMPYANMNREYQPNVVAETNFKPLRDRTYALVAKLNSKISGNGYDRKKFMESAALHEKQHHNSTIAGKPMIVGELGAHRKMGNEVEILEAYRDTIFCPCLRGDEPPQKRFFDVILSGCLPVVLEYESVEEGYPSWFAVGTAAVHNVFPFATGTLHGMADMGIRYVDFVVTINGTCGASCIIPQLEDLLKHDMDKLNIMHDKMKQYARLFSYGMRENAWSGVDAMSAILVEARHYVDNWSAVEETEMPDESERVDVTYNTSLAPILDETVRILLPPKQAKEYIKRFPGSQFKFFVYTDLPEEYTWQANADCLNIRSDTACDWGESICVSNNTEVGAWPEKRANRNGDLVVSKAFAQYHGPSRTYDPSDAGIFIVPWPSQAYQLCRGYNYNRINEELVGGLKYYNETSKERHLFISSGVWGSSSTALSKTMHLMVTIGPVQKQCLINADSVRRNCPKFVMGHVNTNPEYQPNKIESNFAVPITQRKLALVAAFATKFAGNMDVRRDFVRTATEHLNITAGTLAGKPMLVQDFDSPLESFSEKAMLESYRNSVFCVILRGADPPQKAFFDAILSGCLPVVLEHDSVEGPDYVSHFAPGAAAIRNVYPFAKGSFYGDKDMGIDYQAFVVGVNGTCGVNCILPTMEDLLVNQPEKLQNMFERMREVAKLLSYGMEHNTLAQSDALAAILVHARHIISASG